MLSPRVQMPKLKILIADDDGDFVKVLQQRLEQEGFQIAAAYEGVRAVEMAHKEKPDLILLDIKMPTGGGLTVLGNLKNHPETKKIPVIIVTGLVERDLEKEARSAGAIDFVRKPFEMKALIEKIKSAKEVLNG